MVEMLDRENRLDADNEIPGRDRIERFLRDLGASDEVVEVVTIRTGDADVRRLVSRFRAYAQENPAVVLGALSAVIVGGAVAVERAVSSSKTRKRAAAKKTASRKRGPKKTAAKRSSARRASSKRTLIEPHAGDKRYIRRDAKGRIKESVDVGRSLSADRRRTSKRRAKSGQGDKGDR